MEPRNRLTHMTLDFFQKWHCRATGQDGLFSLNGARTIENLWRKNEIESPKAVVVDDAEIES